MRKYPLILAIALAIVGCQTQHEVAIQPVEVKPIHITIDVNIKVDRALNDFFDEIDQAAQEIEVSPEAKPQTDKDQ